MTGPYIFFQRVENRAECTVRGVLPAAFLNGCTACGVDILTAQPGEDDYTVTVTLRSRDLPRARRIAADSRCELAVVRITGGRILGRRLLRRVAAIVGAAALAVVLLGSRCFIWEMEVYGNETVPSAKILNALGECGVAPGTFWPRLTSDNLRSELLVRMPELAWATVNIYGSRAEVIVRERVPKPKIHSAETPVDLVADRVGFVTQVRALSGTAQVRPGSAVMPGDVLIAGETNSVFSGRRTVHALGSVRANTYYELTACAPAVETVKIPQRSYTRWALEIGKKRYNIFRNSSICDADCDKIKTTWECKREGLFYLPVALVREQITHYATQTRPADASSVSMRLEQALYERLTAALGADAQIESIAYSRTVADGSVAVCLRARCSEDIAQEQHRLQEDAAS